MIEDWRPVVGWPYEVSDHGRVRRIGKARTMFPKPDQDGYPRATLCDMPRLQTFKVHTLVCCAFHGPPPEGMDQVRHLDGTKDNNTPGNLCWGTALDNAADRLLHGKDARGEKSGKAVFSQAEVDRLRADYAQMLAARIASGRQRVPRGWLAAEALRLNVKYDTLASILQGNGYCYE